MADDKNHWSQKYLDDLNNKIKSQSQNQKQTEPVKSQAQSKPVEKNEKRQENKPPFQKKDKFRKDHRPGKFSKDKDRFKSQKPEPKKEIKNQPPPKPVQPRRVAGGVITSIDHDRVTVLSGNQEFTCELKDNFKGKIFVGDRVQIAIVSNDRAALDRLEPRQNHMSAPFGKDQKQDTILAANVNQILIVLSVKEPMLRTDWLDAHLVVCEKKGFKPILCVTKIDLAEDNQFIEQMEVYKRIGYRIIYISTSANIGVQELRPVLKGKTTLLTGHTGVGKTALFQALTQSQKIFTVAGFDEEESVETPEMMPDEYIETKTVRAVKFEGGYLIDSPGIREYEIRGIPKTDLKKYFREFRNVNSLCAHPQCQHADDEGCKIRDVIASGLIAEDRYQNYLRLMESL